MGHYKAKKVALGEELTANIRALNDRRESYKVTVTVDSEKYEPLNSAKYEPLIEKGMNLAFISAMSIS